MVSKDMIAQQLFENVRFAQNKFAQTVIILLGINGYSFTQLLDPNVPPMLKTRFANFNIIVLAMSLAFVWAIFFFVRRNQRAYSRLVADNADLLYAFPSAGWTAFGVVLLSISILVVIGLWLSI